MGNLQGLRDPDKYLAFVAEWILDLQVGKNISLFDPSLDTHWLG